MALHSPPPGFLLRSVALRYTLRAPRRWPPETARPANDRGGRGEQPWTESAPGRCRRDQKLAAVEAVLFAISSPLAPRKLSQYAGLEDPTQARTLVRRLNDFYQRSQSAFRVVEVAGGWRLMTHPSLGGWLRRLHPAGSGARLSSPALETLAIVAYRQPVLRAEIEEVRGVQCGEMLRQLMDRDLVRIVGKSPDLGRPFLYGTTPRFLECFGLRHLDDLPRAAELRRPHGAEQRAHEPIEVTPGETRAMEFAELTPDLKEEPHT